MQESVLEHLKPAPVSLHPEMTLSEALQEIKKCENPMRVTYFYVVDRSGAPIGVLPTRHLLFGSEERSVEELMTKDELSLQMPRWTSV